MYSNEDRIRAVKLFIKLGKRPWATIRQLGYPTKNSLIGWCREYERSRDLRVGYSRSGQKYFDQQKQAAVQITKTMEPQQLLPPSGGMLTCGTRKSPTGLRDPTTDSPVAARHRDGLAHDTGRSRQKTLFFKYNCVSRYFGVAHEGRAKTQASLLVPVPRPRALRRPPEQPHRRAAAVGGCREVGGRRLRTRIADGRLIAPGAQAERSVKWAP